MTSQTLIARNGAETVQLMAELERRSKSARDVIIPAHQFRLNQSPDLGPALGLPLGIGEAWVNMGLTAHAHAQTASKLNIPKAYYDRMMSVKPDLLCDNVNAWTTDFAEQDGSGKNWLLRTLDGAVRANVSDRFRMLDNYDLAFATLGVARQVNAQVTRFSLNDDRFEMRLIVPEWEERIEYKKETREVGTGLRGSRIIPGIYVSNSETGRGALTVSPFLLDLVCANGMVGEKTLARRHVGSQNDAGVLSRETIALKDAAVWSEVKDLVTATFDRDRFQTLIALLQGTASMELDRPIEAVDAVVSHYEMDDADKAAILNELISPSHDRDPGRTVFGLLSAITERAKVYADSDVEKATTLEAAGLDFAQRAEQLVRVR